MAIETTKTDTLIAFEHPVTEQIRLYLRLEYLYNSFHKHMQKNTADDSKMALEALLKMINVVDRPDLKSKLVQTLSQHMRHLTSLNNLPNINNQRLQETLASLESNSAYLHEHQGKIAESLRQNEFLKQMRMRLTNPTGLSENSLPVLQLWLRKSAEERQDCLHFWGQQFEKIMQAMSLLLSLIRQSTQTITAAAKQGLYQQDQDTNLPCELIRISIDAEYNCFPEFSANKHRFMIRFMQPDLYDGGKAKQTTHDVEFYLRCCR